MTFDSKLTPDMWGGILSEANITYICTVLSHAHFKEQIYTSYPAIFIFNELYLAVTTFDYIHYLKLSLMRCEKGAQMICRIVRK